MRARALAKAHLGSIGRGGSVRSAIGKHAAGNISRLPNAGGRRFSPNGEARVGEWMNRELEICADWEMLQHAAPEERACVAALGIRYGSIWLTEAEDAFVKRVREQGHLSAYRFAEWLAWNWCACGGSRLHTRSTGHSLTT
jgi:hypothetical protein